MEDNKDEDEHGDGWRSAQKLMHPPILHQQMIFFFFLEWSIQSATHAQYIEHEYDGDFEKKCNIYEDEDKHKED